MLRQRHWRKALGLHGKSSPADVLTVNLTCLGSEDDNFWKKKCRGECATCESSESLKIFCASIILGVKPGGCYKRSDRQTTFVNKGWMPVSTSITGCNLCSF